MSAVEGMNGHRAVNARSRLLTQLRHRNCSRAAVDTPSDGVHAVLARLAFEAVSATNLVPINNRAEPFSIRLTDQFGFEWARAP
jgi:hypothetical protein